MQIRKESLESDPQLSDFKMITTLSEPQSPHRLLGF